MATALTTATPRLLGVGTSGPSTAYSQAEVLDLFEVSDPKVRSVFLNSAIDRRYLTMPPVDAAGRPSTESQGELLRKHTVQGLALSGEAVVARLLAGTGLGRRDIDHWVVHSGGKKVIDSLRVNLGLTRHDVRHTTGVLRDYGNVSSGSFLFSYRRLLDEGVTRPGEHGVLMTMGPGSTIETALLRF